MTSPGNTAAQPGEHYVYNHTVGLGEQARGEMLHPEMAEIDMQPGTEVVVTLIDDAGWPVVQWTDAHGIDRRTAIETTTFGSYFDLVP